LAASRRPDLPDVDQLRAGHCGAVLGGGRRPGTHGPESGSSAIEAAGLVGCGEVDPETGLHEWYEPRQGFQRPPPPGAPEVTWGKILEVWDFVEQDLHQYFQVDLGNPEFLDNRSWRWLRTRVVGCFGVESGRVHRHFAPPDKNNKPRGGSGGAKWH
jgi:hypothetical protein